MQMYKMLISTTSLKLAGIIIFILFHHLNIYVNVVERPGISAEDLKRLVLE
jgi:vacuolar-type H+-ATPase subunit I/STV1